MICKRNKFINRTNILLHLATSSEYFFFLLFVLALIIVCFGTDGKPLNFLDDN